MKKEKEQIQKISAHVQFETVSPATKLLQKRRKMYEVHQAFEVQRQQFRKQQQTFKGVQEDIRKKDLDIQIHLITFCQFLQENDSKRKKAQERFKQEQQVFKKKQQEILRLQEQISAAQEKQKKFDKKVAGLKKYEQYLEKVRTAYGDQYPEMSDILSRYQTLKKFNSNLLKERETMEQVKEKLKKQSMTLEKQMNQSILTLNNQIKDLSKKVQDRLNKKQQLQSELQLSRDQYAQKNLKLGKILIALDNLYSKCSQGIIRVKHQYNEYKNQNDGKKSKNKKEKDDKKKQKQDKKQDDQNNIQLKCRIALQKLKSIFAYTKDYIYIVEEFKKNKK